MTDEEKADEYHLNNVTNEEVYYHAGMSEKVRKAYLDGLAEGRKELEFIIKNYQKVINELMGTQLTNTEEVSRLINIAHYQKWEEL